MKNAMFRPDHQARPGTTILPFIDFFVTKYHPPALFPKIKLTSAKYHPIGGKVHFRIFSTVDIFKFFFRSTENTPLGTVDSEDMIQSGS